MQYAIEHPILTFIMIIIAIITIDNVAHNYFRYRMAVKRSEDVQRNTNE